MSTYILLAAIAIFIIYISWSKPTGPWVVVGRYYDDNNVERTYLASSGAISFGGNYSGIFQKYKDAEDYSDWRNEQSDSDPLDTTFHIMRAEDYDNQYGGPNGFVPLSAPQ